MTSLINLRLVATVSWQARYLTTTIGRTTALRIILPLNKTIQQQLIIVRYFHLKQTNRWPEKIRQELEIQKERLNRRILPNQFRHLKMGLHRAGAVLFRDKKGCECDRHRLQLYSAGSADHAGKPNRPNQERLCPSLLKAADLGKEVPSARDGCHQERESHCKTPNLTL